MVTSNLFLIMCQPTHRMGHTIGEKGPIAIRMAKECIMAADNMTLGEGLKFERRNFHALFATNDQKEVSKVIVPFSNSNILFREVFSTKVVLLGYECLFVKEKSHLHKLLKFCLNAFECTMSNVLLIKRRSIFVNTLEKFGKIGFIINPN